MPANPSASERYAILAPSTAGDEIGALATILVAVIAIAAVAPIAHAYAGPNPGFVSLIYTGLTLGTVCCAGMLAALYRVSAREPLAVLALAYGFGSFIIALYVLALPGVLVPGGSLGGSASAEWLWVVAHVAFIALSLAYACSERIAGYDDHAQAQRSRTALRAAIAGIVTVLFASVFAALVGADRLPALISGNAFTPLLGHRIAPLLVVGYAVAIASLYRLTRLATMTQLWVSVVLVALACEVMTGGIIANARYSAGWYASCFEGVVAAGAFLNVMARHVNSVLVGFAASNRVLADRSVRDALTQLLNRRGFDDRMAELAHIQRRRRISAHALAIVDIDHFKAVNDAFGHVAGDAALRAVAGAIAGACARSRDECYRLGGEEFAIVLPATDEHGALVVAERIRAAVRALRLPSGNADFGPILTVSIGIAVVDGVGEVDSLELYRRADAALLAAKRTGRDRVLVYEAARLTA
jgi:diguanylate cyclase (GGDEF)-like protein